MKHKNNTMKHSKCHNSNIYLCFSIFFNSVSCTRVYIYVPNPLTCTLHHLRIFRRSPFVAPLSGPCVRLATPEQRYLRLFVYFAHSPQIAYR